MNPVNIRLLNQQLEAPQFTQPEQVVAHLCAVQAQDYRMMRWAVEMRTTKPSHATFKQAFDQGKIIRLHLLRGTWQLVSADDYWWMLDLCAPKAKSVIKGWMSSNKISISDEELLQIRNILIETSVAKGSVTKDDFAQALIERGIAIDNQRLSYHIRFAELSGLLCSGNLHSQKATYVLAESKVKHTPKIDRDEALMLLTQRYFQSRQPATLDDFVWWSGLGVNDCRRGIALLGNHIHVERFKERDFYITDDCRTRGFRNGHSLLIAPYDEYLIGYKSRDIVLDPKFKHDAHNNSGIFKPVIAYNGTICGNWAPVKKCLEYTLFDKQDEIKGLSKAWEQYIMYKQ